MIDLLNLYKKFREHSILDESNFTIDTIKKDVFWEHDKVTFDVPLSEYSKEELAELNKLNKRLTDLYFYKGV